MNGKKRVQDISKGKISDTKYYDYIVTCLNYIILMEKIFVVMQSGNVV